MPEQTFADFSVAFDDDIDAVAFAGALADALRGRGPGRVFARGSGGHGAPAWVSAQIFDADANLAALGGLTAALLEGRPALTENEYSVPWRSQTGADDDLAFAPADGDLVVHQL